MSWILVGVGHSCYLHSHYAETAAGLLESIRRIRGLHMYSTYIVCSMALISALSSSISSTISISTDRENI